MGIHGRVLDWFRSYLTDRYQSVHVCGNTSEQRLLTYGVPQGSVGGPHYSAPVADIAEEHGVAVHLYADDTQLYVPFILNSHSDQQSALAQIEDCIQDIRLWMTENKLKLNEDKTEFLLITPSRQTHKCNIEKITIGNSDIYPSAAARNLGVMFDDRMNMNAQVNAVVKSCNMQLRSIGEIRKYLSTDAAQNLIHAFITSRLDNGNSLLYGLPDYMIQKLQRVQNKAARILSRTPKYNHITPILKTLHWLPVKSRIDFKILTLTFKCLNDLAPEYLSEKINVHISARNLRSSDCLTLNVPKTNLKTYGDRSFSKAAPYLWNALPANIRNLTSLESFKAGLKEHLFQRSY